MNLNLIKKLSWTAFFIFMLDFLKEMCYYLEGDFYDEERICISINRGIEKRVP